MHSTTLSSSALMIWKALQIDYQLDANELFLAAGLDPTRLNDPAYRYPDQNILELWQIALEKTQDECIGLKVAQHIHPTTLNALGFAWLSSATLLDALERLIRFYRIVTDVDKLELIKKGEFYGLKLVRIKQDIEAIAQDDDTFFAALIIMCEAICGNGFRPAHVEMQRPQPACVDEIERFFAIPVKYSSDMNVLWFHKATITDTLPTANANLAREHDQIIIRYLSKMDKDDIVMQVKSKLIESLPTGTVTEDDIANSLHMSKRTLQRKLTYQNISFKEIMDETRRQIAVEYVREDNVPMTEITFLLGYSEQANFTRAFKRWTGFSPSEFRRSH